MLNDNIFISQAKKSFQKQLKLEEAALDPALKTIEAEGGRIDLEVYHAEKFEKVVFCTINMFATSVVEATVMAWPDDNHEFPVLWCNLTVVPEVMNVPIFDFIPLTDIVLRPDYAGTYISGVNDLKKKAFDVFGETLLDKDAELPSLTIYALSPYRFVGMVSDAGVELVPRVAEEYIAAYADLSANAQPLTDNSNRAYCKT
ncbi:MAG: hypothetical protein GY868_16840, partial [Deltaproteobacteria bacterium]|nr:hypothetical protein [Deltaproteobacteria bacterium]